jgi:hypothetical protein
MQHVFRHIIPTHDVFWVNSIGHRVPQLGLTDLRRAVEKGSRLARRPAPAPTVEGPQPSLIEPKVLPWHHWELVHRWNTRSLERSIRQTLRAAGIMERPVLVTGTPPSAGIVGRLDEVASLYFCMDDFLHLPGVTTSMIGPLEQRLLERVDVVVATVQFLVASKQPRSGVAHYLPQGVSYEHFRTPQPVPDDLASLPRPWIGFAGAISDCCDLDLLNTLAGAIPNGSIVLVGPVTVTDPQRMDRLTASNIHQLGPRPYAELPGFVQAFDVGIIPYLLNPWTEAVDPLKLLEYLASGIPVVSTRLPEVEKYADDVAIADTVDAFAAMTLVAANASPEARSRGQRTASQHDWSARAARFLEIVDEAIEAQQARRSA